MVRQSGKGKIQGIQHCFKINTELLSDNRSTNGSAESFNAKIKAFRSAFRGVKNVSFFLFRLVNIKLRNFTPQKFRLVLISGENKNALRLFKKQGTRIHPVVMSGIEPPTQGFSVLCSTN
jgi:hypothetical protein